jgi:hypothetical protein
VGVFSIAAIFVYLLLVRYRSFALPAYQQWLVLVEAGLPTKAKLFYSNDLLNNQLQPVNAVLLLINYLTMGMLTVNGCFLSFVFIN